MNVRAPRITGDASIAMARAEHISIETPEETHTGATRRARGRARAKYQLKSKLHGCETELALFEDHVLTVRMVRPASLPKKYDIDLRFANAQPVRVREISWTWFIVTLGLLLLSTMALLSIWAHSPEPWAKPGFFAALATLAASFATAALCLRRTTESLQFRSVHGEATLVNVTGGIGSARNGKPFFVQLIKDINAAKRACGTDTAQYLRDEMREHYRLREVGAFSEEEYEASKARILSAHA